MKKTRFWLPALAWLWVNMVIPLKGQVPVFQRSINPFPVNNQFQIPYPYPFLGGLNAPRPQWVDLDMDGDLDLFVQVEFNKLMYLENVGSPTAPQLEWVTDWFQQIPIGSWYLFRDMDGDGDSDLFCEHVYGLIRYYRNEGGPGNPQFVLAADTLRDDAGNPIPAESISIPALTDIDCDGFFDLFTGNSLDGTINHYQNTGNLPGGVPQFHFVTNQFQGISIIGGGRRSGTLPHGANAIEFADIDGDQDQDLFWGDFFTEGIFYLGNNGTCNSPSIQITDSLFPRYNPVLTGGFNVPRFADVDGDGDLDFFVGVQGGAISNTRNLVDNFFFLENVGTAQNPFYTLSTTTYLPGIDIGDKSTPALADIDADGDLDLFLANEVNPPDGQTAHLYFFRNTGTPHSPAFTLVNTHYGTLELGFNYMPSFGDLDGDGDLDLLIGEWSGNLNYLRNDGTPQQANFVLVDEQFAGIDVGLNSAPCLGDLDGDGDLDLLVGEFSGNINFYRNEGSPGNPQFVLDTTHLAGIDVGQHSAPALADIDYDGDLDLFVGNADGLVTLYRNQGTPQQANFVLDPSWQLTLRTYTTPFLADLDADGDADLLVGNVGGGLYYFENQEVQTGIASPAPTVASPVRFLLLRAYPNPFNPRATLQWAFEVPAFWLGREYRVRIFAPDGKLIQQWEKRIQQPGVAEQLVWTPRNARGQGLASGVYFLQISLPDGSTSPTTKLLYLK